jgi:3-hydroxymyristoyl/3-hydroxydecanoyl-(acyl carrier protein) dehydratase
MRFLFVDRITHTGDAMIKGEKFFGKNDPMQYLDANGEMQVAPGVISEAIGQLASWLCIKKNNFSGRPVFLFADTIQVHAPIKPDANVDLIGTIDEMNDQTFVFSGQAFVGDKLVHSISSCSGYFMPLSQLEDPEVSRERFDHMVGNNGLVLQDDGQKFDFNSLVDQVVEVNPGDSITVRKQMKLDEPFYKDHFPRFPVTPIVMINEMIGRATQKLLESEGQKSVFPRAVSGVKIKNFVRPGETCDVRVKILDRVPRIKGGTENISVVAEIIKDNKRILRGNYSYQVS